MQSRVKRSLVFRRFCTRRSDADDSAFIPVTGIDAVREMAAEINCLGRTIWLEAGRPSDRVRLIQRTKGFAQIIEFVNDRALQFHESDQHAQDQNCADKHDFCGQNGTNFIIPEFVQHDFIFRVRVPSL